MSLTKISALVVAAALTLGLAAHALAEDAFVVDAAIATMTPDELVAARKAAMREDGGLLRNAGKLTGADAVAAADTLIHNFGNFPALFPEGSIVGDSKASPAIWENFDDFKAIFAKAFAAANDMKAAATANDAAAYGAALQTIGGTCGECHQKYRG